LKKSQKLGRERAKVFVPLKRKKKSILKSELFKTAKEKKNFFLLSEA
jgi:hypothetical protein